MKKKLKINPYSRDKDLYDVISQRLTLIKAVRATKERKKRTASQPSNAPFCSSRK